MISDTNKTLIVHGAPSSTNESEQEFNVGSALCLARQNETWCRRSYSFSLGGGRYDIPTMMLLIGMKMSFTKKPTNPMIANPTVVAIAIFENSFRSGFVHRFSSLVLSLANCFTGVRAMFAASMLVAKFELSDGHRKMHETPLNK
eukprot:EC123295.1.p1 GENE.EC123295.1~~EC123295.1.p1  ORF type:complete len:145 (-),score=0.23 EC123295.1:50-484(-)